MNSLILSLIIVPLIFALLFYISKNTVYYRFLSYILCAFGAITSIILAINGPVRLSLTGPIFAAAEGIITVTEVLILVFLFWISVNRKKRGVLSLTFLQTILFFYSTFFMERHHEAVLNVTSFSIIMLLLVNIIGTLIVVFANGYITEYEHHRHMKSKQNLFYLIICLFLSAMNGLVISDSLAWVYFFWEITTLSSFILISYNGDEEAYASGFKALFINLIGGLCFSVGNILLQHNLSVSSLSDIAEQGKILATKGTNSHIFIVAVFLLCIAGFAKSAQMPFQSWLLGAMVAPTPVSALLHSSTMVKAGVYLIVKLSPAYAGTKLGTAIALYGGITFLLCSAIAITQRNAKRILAYSTIANLGLIVCSAGMGTSMGIAAAIILIVFHAISKALLFLCTGQIEHTIGSRDVEDMSGLIVKAPILAVITGFALVSMILPPFGVLVTKLISIEAAANNPILVILLVLGSALTTLYYIKWIGTIVSYPASRRLKPEKTSFDVYLPLLVLSCFILAASMFVSIIYNKLVSPEIAILLPTAEEALKVSVANISSKLGGFNGNMIFIALGLIILVALVVRGTLVRKATIKKIYMCGENNLEDESLFRGPDGSYEKAVVGNYYLMRILDERLMTRLGTAVSVSLILMVILGGLA